MNLRFQYLRGWWSLGLHANGCRFGSRDPRDWQITFGFSLVLFRVELDIGGPF